jgi:hypothetical protein
MRRLSAVLLLACAAASGRADGPPPAADGLDPCPPAAPEACPEEDADKLRVGVDYLYWFLNRMRVPPLVTTGTPESGGVLGAPGTELLYGDGRLESRHGRYVGVRADADYWFGRGECVGLSASAFFLERDSSNFTVRQHTVPVLAIPYVRPSGDPWAYTVAGPAAGGAELSGGVNVYSRVELFGEDVNLLLGLARGDGWRLDGLAGARFVQIRERLDLTATSRLLPDEAVLFGLTDHFHTFNKFYGGQLGLRGECRLGRWSLEARGTVALGADDQLVETKGDRLYQTPLVRETNDYGLFVLPSNRGSFSRTDFDVVSELRVDLGYDLTRYCRVRVGYTLLTWDNPVRPGDQIGPIDRHQVEPGGRPVSPPLPVIPFREDFFWAQGGNVGLELRW